MTFLPIPIGTDRPQRRFPWMNVALIAANVIIYLVSRPHARAPGDHISPLLPLAPDFMQYLLDPRHPRLIQFITYQFLHEGPSHIIFNMLFLYVFGNNLNEKLGHAAYLLFYLTGGILAGCGHFLTSNNPTLGASGAISAVSGLFLVLLPRAHIRMFVWIIIYVDVWEIPSMFFILFKIGQDIFEQIAGGAHVAYMAHLAGTVAGILIGLLLLLTHLVQRDHYDLLAIFARYRRQQEYRTLVSKGFDPFLPAPNTDRRAHDFKPPPPVDPRVTSLRDEIARLLRLHDIPGAARSYLDLIAVDPAQVLAEPDQLDVANQLMADRQYGPAAAAYENFLRTYPTSHQLDKVSLILAVIYAHYLPRPERAREILRIIIPRLHDPAEKQMAESELKALEAPPFPSAPHSL